MRVRPTPTLPHRGLGIWGLGVGLGQFLNAADIIGNFADQVGEVIVMDAIVECLAMQVIHRVRIVLSQLNPLPAAVLSQLAKPGVYMPAGRVMDSGNFPNQSNGSTPDSQPFSAASRQSPAAIRASPLACIARASRIKISASGLFNIATAPAN